MGSPQIPLHLLANGLNTVVLGRYTILAAYVVCIYDWITSLDQEVAFIYPAPWNLVKCAYLFCRHYPMAIAPFQLWGLLGDHDQSFCESHYRILFSCALPTILSSQFILLLRTYAFSGRNKSILVLLSSVLLSLIGVMIWVTSKQLSLSLLFISGHRSGCFAVSDQPSLGQLQASLLGGGGPIKLASPIAYHIGMISIISTFFDSLNMFIVVWYCIQRGTLGRLGQTFLKQGMLVYAIMTALNAVTIVTFFSPSLVRRGLGSTSSFAYILPSALACRLVLMLRREASPTQTELRLEHSHMIDEALEMITLELHSKGSDGFVPSISTDVQAMA